MVGRMVFGGDAAMEPCKRCIWAALLQSGAASNDLHISSGPAPTASTHRQHPPVSAALWSSSRPVSPAGRPSSPSCSPAMQRTVAAVRLASPRIASAVLA